MADKKVGRGGKRDNDPRNVPLGNGLAGRARSSILNRRRSIDAAVDAATGRMRNAQSTDSNN